MDNFLGLSNFDVIAYLMVGLAAFVVLDLVFGSGFLFRTTWNTGSVTGIVLFAYLLGHVISIPSRFLFEELAASDCLGDPVVRLVPTLVENHYAKSSVSSCICEPLRRTVWHAPVRWILGPEYFELATQDVWSKIDAKRPHPVASLPDSKAFWHEAYQTAKHDPIAYERADIFQRLSILFRNMAFLSLVGLFAAVGKGIGKGIARMFRRRAAYCYLIYYGVPRCMRNPWIQAGIFLVLTVGLFNRYLFFYRLFNSEIITAFAYAPSPVF